MFISRQEKEDIAKDILELWRAISDITEVINSMQGKLNSAPYGFRQPDGQPRKKLGRPVGSKNKPKEVKS